MLVVYEHNHYLKSKFQFLQLLMYKLESHLISKPNKPIIVTTINYQSVSILSWYNAPIKGLDFSLCSNFGLFEIARVAPDSVAFSRGPSSDEFSFCRRSSHLVPSPPLFVRISADRWLDIWNLIDKIHPPIKVVKQLRCIISLTTTKKTQLKS